MIFVGKAQDYKILGQIVFKQYLFLKYKKNTTLGLLYPFLHILLQLTGVYDLVVYLGCL